MNGKGNVMNAMVGGLMFIIGLLLLTVIWSPLYTTFHASLNSQSMTGTGAIDAMVLLIPMIVTFTGAVMVIKEATNSPQQGQYYG